MSRILKRIAAGVAIAGVAALLLAAGGYAAGARVNTTKSIPVGLYWTSSAPVEKGAYVLFCPPQLGVFDDAKERGYIGAGFCQGGYGYMMKRVLAAKDDAVAVADDGVRVNGEQQLGAAQMATLGGDGEGLALEAGADGAKLLLLAGEPIDEPVVGYGPFVMNSREQIEQAIADFNAGRFGRM